jgi:oxalate decarboxylase family bicupin protein
VLAKNFGQPVEAFKNIPLHNRWIYQSKFPAPPLSAVEEQIAAAAGKPPNPFVFRLGDMQPSRETKSGTVRIADSTNFLVSKTIAASMVSIKPGGMREMHWHPNADEWLYILKGAGRATVFNTGPAAITANFHAGDIGYVKRRLAIISRIPATPISSIWKYSARTGLRKCRCPIGWRTAQSRWLRRRSTSIHPSSSNSPGTGPTSFRPSAGLSLERDDD